MLILKIIVILSLFISGFNGYQLYMYLLTSEYYTSLIKFSWSITSLFIGMCLLWLIV